MAASNGKTALVTGASKRIGRFIALELARQGWTIGVHYRTSEADAAALAGEIEAGGGRAAAVQADLSAEDETEILVARTAAALGPVGCLINNASVFENDQWQTVSRASWDQHMQVNARAPLILSTAFASQLPADANGCIVNIVDQRVWN